MVADGRNETKRSGESVSLSEWRIRETGQSARTELGWVGCRAALALGLSLESSRPPAQGRIEGETKATRGAPDW